MIIYHIYYLNYIIHSYYFHCYCYICYKPLNFGKHILPSATTYYIPLPHMFDMVLVLYHLFFHFPSIFVCFAKYSICTWLAAVRRSDTSRKCSFFFCCKSLSAFIPSTSGHTQSIVRYILTEKDRNRTARTGSPCSCLYKSRYSLIMLTAWLRFFAPSF